MAWKHKTKALTTLRIDGRDYEVGVDGTISPDPLEEDRANFARMPDVVDMDAPAKATPPKPPKRRPARKAKVAKK